MNRKTFLVSVVAALFFAAAQAEIKLPSIFSDNMLLQRGAAVKIWGKADAGAKVEVAFAGQKKSAKAGADGKWSVFLDKMQADKTPREMSVSENGKVSKTVKNILVGEVWIAGGQSNMGFTLKNCDDAKKHIASSANPLIRYFSQNTASMSKKPREDSLNGKWTECSPEASPNYSGVAYFFARALAQDLDVPVGVVFAALGGSRMIAWLPAEYVDAIPYTKKVQAEFLEKSRNYSYDEAVEKYKKAVAKWKKNADALKAKGKKPPRKPFAPNKTSPWRPTATPVYLYNSAVAPIAGFGARGVIWYQGESDSNGEPLESFNEQFDLVVKSWREKFGNPDLVFIETQLASYCAPQRDWGLTRWKQYLATKSIPRCHMANIIDCGDEHDIHPKDKLTVGTRLEKVALREVYGKKAVRPYGPIMASVKYTPAAAEITFALDGAKLVGKGEPRGFELKIGGEWKSANAELAGQKVKVSPAGNGKEKIEGVRYLWKNWARPDVWLFGSNDLPAMSFTHEK